MPAAGLPRQPDPGFNDVFPRSGLLPSPDEERILLQTATAGELQSSLMRLEGVLEAQKAFKLKLLAAATAGAITVGNALALLLVSWVNGDCD